MRCAVHRRVYYLWGRLCCFCFYQFSSQKSPQALHLQLLAACSLQPGHMPTAAASAWLSARNCGLSCLAKAAASGAGQCAAGASEHSSGTPWCMHSRQSGPRPARCADLPGASGGAAPWPTPMAPVQDESLSGRKQGHEMLPSVCLLLRESDSQRRLESSLLGLFSACILTCLSPVPCQMCTDFWT